MIASVGEQEGASRPSNYVQDYCLSKITYGQDTESDDYSKTTLRQLSEAGVNLIGKNDSPGSSVLVGVHVRLL